MAAAPRTWKVVLLITDTPANREKYLSKEEIIKVIETISVEAGVDYRFHAPEIVIPTMNLGSLRDKKA